MPRVDPRDGRHELTGGRAAREKRLQFGGLGVARNVEAQGRADRGGEMRRG